MKDRDIEILRMRFILGETLQAIGDKFELTREAVRLSIKKTIIKMGESMNLSDLNNNSIVESEDDDIIKLAYMMGLKHRKTLQEIIIDHGISSLKDFVLLSNSQIKHRTAFGKLLKLNLFKLGVVYDTHDDFETLERSLMRHLSRNKQSESSNGKQLRFKILNRDNFTCQYCGKNPKNHCGTILEVDHIIPLSKGGSWSDDNLITACRECNAGKSDLLINLS